MLQQANDQPYALLGNPKLLHMANIVDVTEPRPWKTQVPDPEVIQSW